MIVLEEIDSTNSHLRRLADSEALPDMTAVRALSQTAGRGQVGNHWESEPDRNLLLSVLHRPIGLDVSLQFYVSMAVSLAVTDVVAPLLDADQRPALKVKWPNDIYVGDKKLAGILIENRLAGRAISDVIVGLGLNVNQEKFLSDAPNPVSVYNLTGRVNDVSQVAEAIVAGLRVRLSQVADADFSGLTVQYMQRMFWADGCMHPFADEEGRFLARVQGVGPDGRLCLMREDGSLRSYLFKEVGHVIGDKSLVV